ncbi:PREDICTED: T-complex protein 1 subunit delta-like [Camelina sativa]|uniref:T-complex protein 1 subunit delta-like n=1 Tax=Camelina sativa TaxID=90675 RepID=A0ABM0YXZ4_CAMSA|nr:PREDICTED: T-complex protein 1 subunit delta-like [Camelina sativa]
MENVKIALIQFQMMMDTTWILKKEEEKKNHILGMIQKIKATGCNTILIPKTILVTDHLWLHYLAVAKIMVIKDVERDAIEYVTKTLNCLPISNIEHFTADKLGQAHLVEESSIGDGMVLKFTLLKDIRRTTHSLIIRSFDQLVLCTLLL